MQYSGAGKPLTQTIAIGTQEFGSAQDEAYSPEGLIEASQVTPIQR